MSFLDGQGSHCFDRAMAEGDFTGSVEVADADPDASAADFLPLDDSDSSDAQLSPNNGQANHGATDDSDSDGDVSMETGDEDSTNEPQAAELDAMPALPNNTYDGSGYVFNRKRKSLDDALDSRDGTNTLEPVKKVKLQEFEGEHQGKENASPDRSRMPAEIWNRIFTFCPPRTLGKLLFVNRLFNAYLDPSSVVQCKRPEPLSVGFLSVLKPNSIWQASRRRFWPGMPIPLKDKSELYMWQLCCSTSCQHCGFKPIEPQQNDASDPWQSGPGKDGVALIWAFATRSCGACLLSKSTKVCSERRGGQDPVSLLMRC